MFSDCPVVLSCLEIDWLTIPPIRTGKFRELQRITVQYARILDLTLETMGDDDDLSSEEEEEHEDADVGEGDDEAMDSAEKDKGKGKDSASAEPAKQDKAAGKKKDVKDADGDEAMAVEP